jgi:hypothetical protein
VKADRFDPAALPLADRHYNRRKVGSPQFVPPGRCLVLRQDKALWVTSWPIAEFTKQAWAGAWVNSLFRNEGAGLSSDLIRSAIAATRWQWPEVPDLGIVTFVDASKVRHKRDPGRCYLRAGFRRATCPKHDTSRPWCAACAGKTEGGLIALQMRPADMPAAVPPLGVTADLVFD